MIWLNDIDFDIESACWKEIDVLSLNKRVPDRYK